MKLMENKVLVFPTIEFNGVAVRNITEVNTLPDIPSKYLSNDYILLTLLDNDRLIEGISFELYETTMYWDLLLKLNGISNLSQLPVNNDVILIRAKNSLDRWMEAGSVLRGANIPEQYDEVISILEGTNYKLNTEGILEKITVIVVSSDNNDDEIVKRKYLEILDNEEEKNEKHREFKYLNLADIAELEAELEILKQTPKIPSELIINISDIE